MALDSVGDMTKQAPRSDFSVWRADIPGGQTKVLPALDLGEVRARHLQSQRLKMAAGAKERLREAGVLTGEPLPRLLLHDSDGDVSVDEAVSGRLLSDSSKAEAGEKKALPASWEGAALKRKREQSLAEEPAPQRPKTLASGVLLLKVPDVWHPTGLETRKHEGES